MTTNWEGGFHAQTEKSIHGVWSRGGCWGAGAAEEVVGCEICPAVPAWVIMPPALDSQD